MARTKTGRDKQRRKKIQEQKIKAKPGRTNPADRRAGIDPSKLGQGSQAQRTATPKEIKHFQTTGRSSAQQERLRATRREGGGALAKREALIERKNQLLGFASQLPEQKQPAPGLSQEQLALTLPEQPPGPIQGFAQPIVNEDIINQDIVNTELLAIQGQEFGLVTEADKKALAQGTFAGLVAGAGALGAGAILATVGAIGAGLVGTGGLAAPSVGVVASGKVAKTIGTSQIVSNTKSASQVTSYLQKLVTSASNPQAVLAILAGGLYTSVFWAPNEKGDAMTTLMIGMNSAAKAEDWDSVLKLNGLLEEANQIKDKIPIVGFTQAELAKFEANVEAGKALAVRAQTALQERDTIDPENLTPEQKLELEDITKQLGQ